MVVNVPIQPIDSSYSKQWHEWIQSELISREVDHITVNPDALKPGHQGGYLDTVGVGWYRSRQLATIHRLIHEEKIPVKERVVFLFHNGWWPVEQLAFLRDMLGAHDWKFIGVFRDGTYDKWDLSARNNMYQWGEHIENGWLEIYDKIIVGSQFHKDTICTYRKVLENKIEVLPWYVEVPVLDCDCDDKENIVVFPHRLDPEKQPELFDDLKNEFKDSGWQFIRTRDLKLDKHSYYQLLADSKIVVSFALLEMFGNAMVEAALLGCIPLVPDRLSYKELFRDGERYKDIVDCKRMIRVLIESPKWLHDSLESCRYGGSLRSSFRQYLNEKSFFEDLFTWIEEI